MELSSVRDREGCQGLRFWIQFHLPKSGGEIQSGEDRRVGSPDVPDAFANLFHGILVDVGVLIEQSEVLHDPESLALLLWYTKYGGVVAGGGLTYYS